MPAPLLHLPTIVARAGGGGSGSGGGGAGGGGGGLFYLFLVLPWWLKIVVVVGVVWAAVASSRAARRALEERRARIVAELATAASLDSTWNPELIDGTVRRTYAPLQAAWSSNDLATMQRLLTPRLFDKMRLELLALHQLGRRNVIESATLSSHEVVEVADDRDDSQDRFVVELHGSADDRLVRADTGEQLLRDRSAFTEYWTFLRSGSTWRLDAIEQATADPSMEVTTLREFARRNSLHYDGDFGRLLLPERGALFGDASLADSDVNNHVIGELRGQLVQLYTYCKDPSGDSSRYTTIVQAALPRTYGDILVRRRKLLQRTPRGLREHEFESAAFNERYRVYAAPGDDVSAFELLNPAFLERLTLLPGEAGIEAVGNSLYLFDDSRSNNLAAQYETMLELLHSAFVELRM